MARYDRSNNECKAFLDKNLPHYHIICLNNELSTPGRVDRNKEFEYLGLTDKSLSQRSVLDIGALDGVLSFNSERSGATRVLAIDVEDPARQDWGWDGPPANYARLGPIKNRVFEPLRDFFSSNVTRKELSVYDLDCANHGTFDIIFFYGVLYHLRHPLLAFDKIRQVASGAVCVETHISNHEPYAATSLFYYDDVLGDADSNWCGPSESCVVAWMRDAGFRDIWVERRPRMQARQRFVGFIRAPTFPINSKNFFQVDADYLSLVRNESARRIRLGNLWRW